MNQLLTEEGQTLREWGFLLNSDDKVDGVKFCESPLSSTGNVFLPAALAVQRAALRKEL